MLGFPRVWRRLREAVFRAERQRIAGDFHDGPLQSVINLQIRLEVARKLLERDPALALEELNTLAEMAKSVVAELRDFQRSMQPPPAAGTNLAGLLGSLADAFQKDSGIPVGFTAAAGPIEAPTEICLEVSQILREALQNVRKHARATRVEVSLGRAGGALGLSIEDNGAGFPSHQGARPQSIERRVRNLGGELRVESEPGRGASLRIRIPV